MRWDEYYDTATAAVAEQFRAGMESEYGADGRQWLANLPHLLDSLCGRWELEVTEPTPLHGYLSLVWRVRRRPEVLAPKVTVPSAVFAREAGGLLAWDRRAMVRPDRCDVEMGAARLHWLDASISLSEVPIGEAVATSGRMLTVTPVVEPTTAAKYGSARIEGQLGSRCWSARNSELGRPVVAGRALGAEEALVRIADRPDTEPVQLVNHDLHYGA